MNDAPLIGEIMPPLPAAKAKTVEQELTDDIGERNAEIALAICDQLASKTEGLEHIAAEAMGKDKEDETDRRSAARQFYKWKNRSSALGRIYTRACQSRAHVLAHSAMAVIDAEPNPHLAKVKLDAIKWLAAKFNRADFGDDIKVTGGDGGAVQVDVNHGGQVLAEIEQRLAKRAQRLAHTQKNEEDENPDRGVGG